MIASLIALLLPALALAAEPREALRVKAVRYWTLGDTTRVAIEMTGEFRFRSERLHNPARVFFDLPGARPADIFGRKMNVIEVNDKLLKRVRVAETAPSITRIVLDLGEGVKFRASQLANPDRLMIELTAGGQQPDEAPADQTSPSSPVTISAQPPSVTAPAPPARPPANTAAKTATDAPVQSAALSGRTPEAVVTPAAKTPETGSPRVPEPAAAAPPRAKPALESARAAPPAVKPAPDPARGARHTSSGGTTLTRALGLKINRVAIDAGHGGHDTGTIGPRGLMEKDLVLDLAIRVGKLVEQRMGAEVVYTRPDDTFVALDERTQLAKDLNADLFLSIHANSSAYSRIGGVETFYLNVTTSREALDVASRENAGAEKSVSELRDILQKIAMNEKVGESKEFAARIQAALHGFESRVNPAAKNRGVKKAPFFVLIGAQMPAVLAEVGFISNPREEAILKRSDHRQKLAEALYKGLARYAEDLSHFQVAAKLD